LEILNSDRSDRTGVRPFFRQVAIAKLWGTVEIARTRDGKAVSVTIPDPFRGAVEALRAPIESLIQATLATKPTRASEKERLAFDVLRRKEEPACQTDWRIEENPPATTDPDNVTTATFSFLVNRPVDVVAWAVDPQHWDDCC